MGTALLPPSAAPPHGQPWGWGPSWEEPLQQLGVVEAQRRTELWGRPGGVWVHRASHGGTHWMSHWGSHWHPSDVPLESHRMSHRSPSEIPLDPLEAPSDVPPEPSGVPLELIGYPTEVQLEPPGGATGASGVPLESNWMPRWSPSVDPIRCSTGARWMSYWESIGCLTGGPPGVQLDIPLEPTADPIRCSTGAHWRSHWRPLEAPLDDVPSEASGGAIR